MKAKIEKICEEYAQSVYRYLICLTNDEELSKDLTQETFYIAIKQIDTFREECAINVWLCKIAKNLWYDELKRKYKEKGRLVDDIEKLNLNDELLLDDIIIKNQEKETLYKQLEKLDKKTRYIIYLRIFGEMSFKEIGDLLKQTETWARVNFYRGKEKIKKYLREENYNERKQ